MEDCKNGLCMTFFFQEEEIAPKPAVMPNQNNQNQAMSLGKYLQNPPFRVFTYNYTY